MKDKKIKELEERIEALEKQSKTIILNPHTIPSIPYNNQNLHYHGNTPCWNNPCIWG